jgi:hypothetical protein
MYLKRCGPSKSKNEHLYWELVESYRTERGPRQRVVAYLGDINQSECQGIKQEAEEKKGYWQSRLFEAGNWGKMDLMDTKVR